MTPNRTWTCPCCGWVNDRLARRGQYCKEQTCTNCRTTLGTKRNVSRVIAPTQYDLLGRNRKLAAPKNNGKRNGRPGGRAVPVMTWADGTAW